MNLAQEFLILFPQVLRFGSTHSTKLRIIITPFASTRLSLEFNFFQLWPQSEDLPQDDGIVGRQELDPESSQGGECSSELIEARISVVSDLQYEQYDSGRSEFRSWNHYSFVCIKGERLY